MEPRNADDVVAKGWGYRNLTYGQIRTMLAEGQNFRSLAELDRDLDLLPVREDIEPVVVDGTIVATLKRVAERVIPSEAAMTLRDELVGHGLFGFPV